jgi:hypothetical protein
VHVTDITLLGKGILFTNTNPIYFFSDASISKATLANIFEVVNSALINDLAFFNKAVIFQPTSIPSLLSSLDAFAQISLIPPITPVAASNFWKILALFSLVMVAVIVPYAFVKRRKTEDDED